MVGDHMPPSKLVKFKEQSWRGVPELLKAVSRRPGAANRGRSLLTGEEGRGCV